MFGASRDDIFEGEKEKGGLFGGGGGGFDKEEEEGVAEGKDEFEASIRSNRSGT